MPKARVKMNKVREIIRLHDEGMSERMISRAASVSRPVTGQYIKQAKAAVLKWTEAEMLSDDKLLERLRGIEATRHDERYSDLLERFPGMLRDLGKSEGKRTYVTRQLLWEEYRIQCPNGYAYSQFCHHLQVFSEGSEISMHLEHEPGEKMFVDYAGKKPYITDPTSGKETSMELFVSVFPSGGLIYIEATRSQDTKDTINATRHALEHAGGTPKIIVPDNLKAAVTKPCRYEPEINQAYDAFGAYYGCVVIPARVRKPKDKALVEAAVKLTYSRVLARLRNQMFATLDELNTALWKYMDQMNDRPMQKVNISRRERFDSIEADLLGSLPSEPYIIRQFTPPITVQKNYHVYFSADKHYYSVPAKYRGLKVNIAFTDRLIEIYAKNLRIAFHRRDEKINQYTTNRDHMPSAHQYQSGLSVEKFLKWAGEIGPETQQSIANVLTSREVPQQAFNSCQGILALAKKHGPLSLELACRMVNQVEGVPSYKNLKRILDKGLELVKNQTTSLQPSLPFHENIRGNEAFATANKEVI